MAVIVPNRKYTFAELEAIRAKDPVAAANWSAKGYAWRFDLDGTAMLVHWTQATGGGGSFGGPQERPLRGFASTEADPFNKADLPKIVKRTPQQRVASLLEKVDDDMKRGRVLGLDKAREITGDKDADPTTSAETRRLIVQSYISQADKEFEAKEARKVVRTSPTD